MNQGTIDILHLLFRNKLYELDGGAYEAFFTKIMSAYDRKFRQVKPQGRIGDRKYDGFIQEKGIYFQVYAPEVLQAKTSEALKKLKEDFDGLYEYWNSISPIKEFFFVVNDKYKGAGPQFYKEIAELQKEHADVKAALFLAKDLEDVFFLLSEHDQRQIIGYIPSVNDVDIDIEYGVVREVVEYLLQIPSVPMKENIPDNPDFDRKIVFNHLGKPTANKLSTYRLQQYKLDDFFSLQSAAVKDNLRVVFSTLYANAMGAIPDSPSKNDEVFWTIFNNSYSYHNLATEAAILTLMSYYFEYCDIFEAPSE